MTNEKQLINVSQYINSDPAESFIKKISDIVDEYSCNGKTLIHTIDDDIYIEYYRYETDDEFNKRIIKEKNEEAELYEQYKKLKNKFEGKEL